MHAFDASSVHGVRSDRGMAEHVIVGTRLMSVILFSFLWRHIDIAQQPSWPLPFQIRDARAFQKMALFLLL